MIGSELDAAGVRDPSLRESYRRCRAINARDGKTFFLATRLLAPRQRPAVHALYGFARRADDILDDFDPTRDVEQRAAATPAVVHAAVQRAGGEPAVRRRPDVDGGGPHRAHVRHRVGSVRRLPGLDADGPHRHRLSGPRPRWTATCTARRR